MFAQTGVDGVSVARGAIGNPWIFPQIRSLARGREMPPPSLYQQREVIAEHYRLAGEIYGEKRCCAYAQVRHQVFPVASASGKSA